MSSSLKSGCAIEMSFSARIHSGASFRFTQPYSVAMMSAEMPCGTK